jgi:hypothetical protein
LIQQSTKTNQSESPRFGCVKPWIDSIKRSALTQVDRTASSDSATFAELVKVFKRDIDLSGREHSTNAAWKSLCLMYRRNSIGSGCLARRREFAVGLKPAGLNGRTGLCLLSRIRRSVGVNQHKIPGGKRGQPNEVPEVVTSRPAAPRSK